jgi:hypothetical protein
MRCRLSNRGDSVTHILIQYPPAQSRDGGRFLGLEDYLGIHYAVKSRHSVIMPITSTLTAIRSVRFRLLDFETA